MADLPTSNPTSNLDYPISYLDYPITDLVFSSDLDYATDGNSTAGTLVDVDDYSDLDDLRLDDCHWDLGENGGIIVSGDVANGGTELATASHLNDFMTTANDDEPTDDNSTERRPNVDIRRISSARSDISLSDERNTTLSGNMSDDDCNATTIESGSNFDSNSMLSTATRDYERIELPSSQSLPRNEDEGNDATGDVDGDYSISDFLKDMGEETLSWKAISTNQKMSLWVFWTGLPLTNHLCVPDSITEKIKNVLFNFMLHSKGKLLAQFWAPKTVAGRRVLTTLDQPFGVFGIDRGFCRYRKLCLDYTIDLDSEIDDDLGIPGRVFRYKWPEITPDVSLYSIQEYPLRNSAYLLGVKRSLALPIVDPCGKCCVGVLEIVTKESVFFIDVLTGVHLALMKEKLESSYMHYDNAKMQPEQTQKCLSYAADEILKILEVVGVTHKLPLAQTWVKCDYRNATSYDLAKSGNSFNETYAEVAFTLSMPYYERDILKTLDFRKSCKEHFIRKGQGVVGKVLLDYKPRFCRDVTQLSTTGYPFAISARNSDLSACFAICLVSIYNVNEVYVLEFFLPSCNAQIPQTLLASIVRTIKQHLGCFKVSSGEEGEELSVEVIELSLNGEVDSIKLTISAMSATSSEVQSGEERQLDLSGVQVIKDSSTVNMRNVESNATVTCSRSTYPGANSSERKRQETDGRKLKAVAESLDVNQSTFTRMHKLHGMASCSTKNIQEVTATVIPMEVTSCLHIKASYKGGIIKFPLFLSSGLAELVLNVTMRLKMDAETLKLKFRDDEGDMVLITCDENLHEFFRCSISRGDARIEIS